MELWIRSQDRTTLSKAINLIIRQNRNEENDINYEIVDIYTMGRYETKERALEVLDEIQSLLMPKLILNSYDNITPEFSQNLTIMPISTDIKQFNSYVYEMPKE